MPTYSYRGYNGQGQRVGGSLSCETRARMEEKVARMGVTDFIVFDSKTEYDPRPYALASRGEMAAFCRQAAQVLTLDGTPAEKMAKLAAQTENRPLRTAIEEISGHVAGGYTIAGAFCMYGHVFGAWVVDMIAAGEASGQLGAVLTDMADFFEQETCLRARLRSAFLYPFLRTSLLWGVVFWLLSRYLPAWGDFPSANGAQTAFAMLVARVTHGFYAHGWVLAPLCLAVIGLLLLAARMPAFRRWLDFQLASLPVMRSVTLSIGTSRLSQGLNCMMRYNLSPVNIDAYLRVLVHNYAMEEKLLNAIRRMRAGYDLPSALEAVKHFPPFFPPAFEQMVMKGYQTGKMADSLAQTAEWFAEGAYRAIDRVSGTLEPVLLALMALLVGMPLLSMLSWLFPLLG